jgi:hypothetical protein
MGDIGIDKWCLRMEEHKRKGHHIIKYPKMDVKKSVNNIKQDLFLKNQRISFWEKHHRIPATNDLIWWERER